MIVVYLKGSQRVIALIRGFPPVETDGPRFSVIGTHDSVRGCLVKDAGYVLCHEKDIEWPTDEEGNRLPVTVDEMGVSELSAQEKAEVARDLKGEIDQLRARVTALEAR